MILDKVKEVAYTQAMTYTYINRGKFFARVKSAKQGFTGIGHAA